MKSFLVVVFIALGSIAIANPTKSIVGARYASNVNEDMSYDATSYVQDGLVEIWDGIENVSYGMHNPSTRSWIGLVNGITLSFDQYVVVDDNAICNASNRNRVAFATDSNDSFSSYLLSSPCFTIEICEDATHPNNLYVWDNWLLCMSGSSSDPRNKSTMIFLQTGYNRAITRTIFGTQSISSYFSLHNLTFVVDIKNLNCSLYRNASYAQSAISTTPDGYVVPFQVGIINKMHCIRVYSKKLSQAEIIHNYSIDKVRFEL